MVHLAFYKGPGNWITWLIRKITRGPYSHVLLLFSDGEGFSSSGHFKPASAYGVRYKNVSDQAVDNYFDLVPVWTTESQETSLRKECNKYVGQSFNWKGLINYLYPFKYSRPEGKWYCTEICLHTLQSCGLLLGLPSHTSPNQLYKEVTKL